jgi:hypothetical protein
MALIEHTEGTADDVVVSTALSGLVLLDLRLGILVRCIRAAVHQAAGT